MGFGRIENRAGFPEGLITQSIKSLMMPIGAKMLDKEISLFYSRYGWSYVRDCSYIT